MHINYMTMWNDLSLKEKSSIMKDFVKRGYRDLASIEKDYNIFAEGGIPEGKEVRVQEEESPDMTSWTKEDLMKKLYYDENGVPRNKETGEYVPLSTPEYVVTPKNNIYRTADRLTWEDMDRMANDAEAPLSAINTGAWGATIAYPNPVTPWVAGTASVLGSTIDLYQGARAVARGDYADAALNVGELALAYLGNKGIANVTKSSAAQNVGNILDNTANQIANKSKVVDNILAWANGTGNKLDPLKYTILSDLTQDLATVTKPEWEDKFKSLFTPTQTFDGGCNPNKEYAYGGGLKSPFSHSPIPSVRY